MARRFSLSIARTIWPPSPTYNFKLYGSMTRLEKIKFTCFRIFLGVVLAVCIYTPGLMTAVATAAPLDSPITVDLPNNLQKEFDPQIDPDYDPCATTAYGEPLYLDNGPINFLSVAEMEAQYQRARMAFLFGNYEYAFKIWEPLAYMGYAKAQATLGWMFYTGKGVRRNLKRSLAWYKVAADNDHAIAQNNLGVFYEQGKVVRKSYKRAAIWYKKAAEVGYSYAQYNLGVLYLNGRGVKENKNQAIYWLQIASLQGVKQASALLDSLGKHQAPQDKIHKISPQKRYHSAALPAAKSASPAPSTNSSSTKSSSTGSSSNKPSSTKSSSTESTPANKTATANSTSIKSQNSEKDIFNESWVTSQNPEHFTLQVAGSDNLKNLLAFAQTLNVKHDLAYYELKLQGKSWYNLISGSFKDEASAKKAKENLPVALKQWSADVRKFSELQKIINAH